MNVVCRSRETYAALLPVEKYELVSAPGARRGRARHRRLDRVALRRVALRVEDDDVRRPDADAECLERALARLVGGLARDREALVPALRDLAGGEAAEEREHEPGADDGPAVTSDEVGEAGEHVDLLPGEN